MKQTLVRLTIGLSLTASALGVTAGAAAAVVSPRPGAPTNVQAVAQSNQIELSWTAPVSQGSSPVTGYHVNGYFGNVATACTTSATSCTVTGVVPGHTYTIRVRAINASGYGHPSVPLSVLAGLPYPPTGLSATAGNGSATVKFTLPVLDNASILYWTMTASPGGQTCVSRDSFPCTVTGLTNGTPYTFTGTSTNPYGTSIPSIPSAPVTPATVPGVPTGVSATATAISGVPAAYVNYSAPASNGGSTITGYTAVVVDQTTSTTKKVGGSGGLATVTGLTATDSYTFSVYATNALGNSVASTPVQAVPQGPTSVTAANVGDGTATISWTPSTVTLGNAVTGFGVSSFDLTAFVVGPSANVSSSTTSTVLSGLTLGDLYDVCVSAQNSLASANETCVEFTAFGPPPGPTGLTLATNHDGTGSVSWNLATGAPPGNPVTGYLVQVLDLSTFSAQPPVSVSNSTTSEALAGLSVGDLYDVCVGSQSAYTTDLTSSCQEITA